MEKEVPVRPVYIVLICDKCGAEIDSTNTSAEVVDGKKVIPTKCQSCGDETIQKTRYPRLVYKR